MNSCNNCANYGNGCNGSPRGICGRYVKKEVEDE